MSALSTPHVLPTPHVLSDLVPLLDPSRPLGLLLQGLHHLGLSWVGVLVAVVVLLRVLQLPLTVHQVRQQRARLAARGDLAALARRYRRRTDAASQPASQSASPSAQAAWRRRHLAEQRAILRAHGVRSWGCLLLLLPLPLWLALYHLINQWAGGAASAGVATAVVASFAGATLAGVPLTARGWTGDATHLAVVLGLALTSAALGYLTQRSALAAPPLSDHTVPDTVAQVQHWLPALSAVGVVVAAGAVPVALLVCWVANAAWQAAQQALTRRWLTGAA